MPPKKYSVWSGRFSKATSPTMQNFNRSFHFDWRLYRVDIRCSSEYARALQRARIITDRECQRIIKGLKSIEKEFDKRAFPESKDDEDIHMAIERRLVELIGEAGKKLASGRSRNDQVATDERLYIRETIDGIVSLIMHLQSILIHRANEEQHTVLPGYTHLQQAQPVLLAHYLLSFFFALERDKRRLVDCRRRMNHLPLGAGAFAGNPYSIDQIWLSKELGFDRVEYNSIDAVSDRDALAELLSACSIIMIHLSRYAEDFILWSTREFGFIELDDAYSTGSSLMPQKKNPDSLELIRGKSGRVIGDQMGLLTTLKGIPLTYAKDLQEDKEPLFDAIDTVMDSLNIFSEIIETTSFKREKMRASIDSTVMATDLADYLVQKGMPFRTSHHVIGALVLEAKEKKMALQNMTLSQFKKHSDLFEKDVYETFDPMRSVNKRKGIGGTALESVRRQLNQAKNILRKSLASKNPTHGSTRK